MFRYHLLQARKENLLTENPQRQIVDKLDSPHLFGLFDKVTFQDLKTLALGCKEQKSIEFLREFKGVIKYAAKFKLFKGRANDFPDQPLNMKNARRMLSIEGMLIRSKPKKEGELTIARLPIDVIDLIVLFLRYQDMAFFRIRKPELKKEIVVKRESLDRKAKRPRISTDPS